MLIVTIKVSANDAPIEVIVSNHHLFNLAWILETARKDFKVEQGGQLLRQEAFGWAHFQHWKGQLF